MGLITELRKRAYAHLEVTGKHPVAHWLSSKEHARAVKELEELYNIYGGPRSESPVLEVFLEGVPLYKKSQRGTISRRFSIVEYLSLSGTKMTRDQLSTELNIKGPTLREDLLWLTKTGRITCKKEGRNFVYGWR